MFSPLLPVSWRSRNSYRFSRGTSALGASLLCLSLFVSACSAPDELTAPGMNEEPGAGGARQPDLESILALLAPQSIPNMTAGSQPVARVSNDGLMLALIAGTISDPMLYGISSGRARAINLSGQAVHNQRLAEGADPNEAIRRDPDGTATRLRPTGSGTATVLDLNDAGIAAGSETEVDEVTGEFRMFPVVWSTDGTPSRLPLAPGSAIQGGAAINESGVVVGAGNSPRRALRWDAEGAHVLPSGTATSSAALDVNDAGVAVGWIAEGTSLFPVTWSAAGLTRLSLPMGAVEGTAAGINNVGQVVGQAVYKDAAGIVTRSDAVLWTVSGVPTVLPGLGFGMAVKINEAGVAAGWTSSIVSGAQRGPVIWANGERIPVPLGDGDDGDFPPWGFVDDLNTNQLAGVVNPDGHDNHDQAALWSFTITGACTAVAITSQPQNTTVLLGRPVTLAVTASGTAPLTYQWQRNGTPIPGATGAIYQIASGTLANAGNYSVVIINGCGSVTSNVARVKVRFNFRGFLQPTKNPGQTAPYVVNRAAPGSAVPMKFSLSGNQGLNILAAGNPRSKVVACTLANTNGGQPTKSVGGGLAYDLGADQYRYIWKTEKAWAGTCRQVMVGLIDGTVHTALFRFNK